MFNPTYTLRNDEWKIALQIGRAENHLLGIECRAFLISGTKEVPAPGQEPKFFKNFSDAIRHAISVTGMSH